MCQYSKVFVERTTWREPQTLKTHTNIIKIAQHPQTNRANHNENHTKNNTINKQTTTQ